MGSRKVESKERLREEEDKKLQIAADLFKRIQEKMTLLVGPCCQYGFNIAHGYLKDYIKKQYPVEYDNKNDLTARRNIKNMYSGKWNKTWSVAGKEIEEIMRKDPSGTLQRFTVKTCEVSFMNTQFL